MNYLLELRAFKDWCLMNQPSTGQIALWHALMLIANSSGWQEWFSVPGQTLELLTGLSHSGIDKARRSLIDRNRIGYRPSDNRKKASKYRMISMCQYMVTKVDELVDEKGNGLEDELETQKRMSKETINKLNKTKKEVSNDTPEQTVKEPEKLKPKKSAKPKQPPNPDHQKVMDHYFESFKNKFGEKPIINGGKDGTIIKNLLATYPAEKIIALLDKFFNSNDSFIRNSGYTLGAFQSQINKLLVDGGQNQKPLPREPDPEDKRKRELIKKLY